MQNVRGKLMGASDVEKLLADEPRQPFTIAGVETLLARLPKGNWIGGTIPYLMTDELGGLTTHDRLLVQRLPVDAQATAAIKIYDEDTIDRITSDAPANGYTLLMIPAFSDVHIAYGREASHFKDLFAHPIAGWITGVEMDELDKTKPKVFNGRTRESHTDKAIALHVPLPIGQSAVVDIVNIFERSDGPDIHFETEGFRVTDCSIDGRRTNFARWLTENKTDTHLPLIADYNGALVNVTVRAVDADTGAVTLFAPVFKDRTYRLARPVPDYVRAFRSATATISHDAPFACNCVANYLYGKLEGEHAGLPGPYTFGEIAFQLLNQTMVYCDVVDTPQARERMAAHDLARQMAAVH